MCENDYYGCAMDVAGAAHPAIAWFLGYIPLSATSTDWTLMTMYFGHGTMLWMQCVCACVLWRLPTLLPCHLVLFTRASMHSRGRTHINNLCLKSNINLLWIFNFWYAALPWTNGTIQFSMGIFDELSQKNSGFGLGEVCAWVYLCVCVCVLLYQKHW